MSTTTRRIKNTMGTTYRWDISSVPPRMALSDDDLGKIPGALVANITKNKRDHGAFVI
jgi:hypothetical protein